MFLLILSKYFKVIGDTNISPKKSQIVMNTQHPNYEEGFTFVLSDNWAECTVEISVLENTSGKPFIFISILKKFILFYDKSRFFNFNF